MTTTSAPLPVLAQIHARLDGIDLISFDVFDTLFLRPFVDAEDLFELAGQHHGFAGFREIRQEAQRQAFRVMKETGRSEIDIELIYDQMPASLPVSAVTLMATEIALEHQSTRPNDEMIAVLRALLDEGRRVVLTSDMYLHADFFEKLLADADLPALAVFSSADCNATKRDHGALFDHVAAATGTPPGRILHIGDNLRGDVEMAEARGVRALRYLEERLPARCKAVGPSASIARGLVRFAADRSDESLYRLGYTVGGPAALGLLDWLSTAMREDRIDHVLLVSRDGYILDRLIDAAPDRFDLPPCTYFRGSRVAFKMAALDASNFDANLPFLLSGATGLSVDELFWRIGVPAPDDRMLADLGMDAAYRIADPVQPEVVGLLVALRHHILAVAAECRRGLYLKLREAGITDGARVAFVDVGWNGTTQDALIDALPGLAEVDLHGYYLALWDSAECNERRSRNTMRALLDRATLPAEDLAAVFRNRVIAEFLFSAPHMPTIGYRVNGTRVADVEDPGRSSQTTDNATAVAAAQDGILAFARDYWAETDLFALKPDAMGLARPLVDFLRDNRPETHPDFAEMRGFDAWGSSRNLSL